MKRDFACSIRQNQNIQLLMNWHFFHDKNNEEPYQSLNDWFKEIKHLVYPFIIMVLLGVLFFIYVKYILI
ncbi:hypothetical protein CJ739_3614 [Mariniflexile rhizosphaerae]|nr:hypothetical protein CJ739_3614 [Mariniflexile sp. TRM1-10]